MSRFFAMSIICVGLAAIGLSASAGCIINTSEWLDEPTCQRRSASYMLAMTLADDDNLDLKYWNRSFRR